MGNCLTCFRAHTESAHNAQTSSIAKNDINEENESVGPQAEPLLNEVHKSNLLVSHMQPSINHNTIVTSVHINSLSPPTPIIQETHKLVDCTPRTFYQKLSSSEPKVSETKINQLFDQYKEGTEDAILAEGIENLCNDLQLDPDEFKILVLAWKLNASQMCRFTRQEFLQGLKSIRTDSVKGIQTRLTELTEELQNNAELFKDLYRFTFKFGLDVSAGQRILPADVAIVLWKLVFTYSPPPILERWLRYLENNSHIRGIPKDTWYMFLNFCEYVRDDLSSYDDTEAWPSLFDDFVEYENDQVNQNISKLDKKLQN